MKKLKITAILEIDENIMYGTDIDAKEWFFKEILKGKTLIVSENEDIGDDIGTLKINKIEEVK